MKTKAEIIMKINSLVRELSEINITDGKKVYDNISMLVLIKCDNQAIELIQASINDLACMFGTSDNREMLFQAIDTALDALIVKENTDN